MRPLRPRWICRLDLLAWQSFEIFGSTSSFFPPLWTLGSSRQPRAQGRHGGSPAGSGHIRSDRHFRILWFWFSVSHSLSIIIVIISLYIFFFFFSPSLHFLTTRLVLTHLFNQTSLQRFATAFLELTRTFPYFERTTFLVSQNRNYKTKQQCSTFSHFRQHEVRH